MRARYAAQPWLAIGCSILLVIYAVLATSVADAYPGATDEHGAVARQVGADRAATTGHDLADQPCHADVECIATGFMLLADEQAQIVMPHLIQREWPILRFHSINTIPRLPPPRGREGPQGGLILT
jgi:hypothetical protein